MRQIFLACTLLVIAVCGCGSSQDAEREWLNIPPMDTTAQMTKTTFETQTDTVNAETEQPQRGQSSEHSAANPAAFFTVQIGSFADAKNASIAQAAARKRYPLPVVNDYDAQRKRYQIRIGFFQSEESASAFCTKLRSEFPKDYKDAWVTQINK